MVEEECLQVSGIIDIRSGMGLSIQYLLGLNAKLHQIVTRLMI